MSGLKLSAHFALDEFRCRCCRRVSVDMRLVEALEELRAVLGRPLYILSGSRCTKHNARVGGEPASRHLIDTPDGAGRRSDAADLACISAREVREYFRAAMKVESFRSGGVGVYPGHCFIHVDTRGSRSRWARLKPGGGFVSCPWEDNDEELHPLSITNPKESTP